MVVSAHAGDRILTWLLPLAAWACYLPLGAKYALLALALPAAAASLRARQLPLAALLAAPPMSAALALLALLALSLAWSPAPWSISLAQLGQYMLVLLVPLLAAACPPQVALHALAHFVAASALVGALFAAAEAGVLPVSTSLWHTTIDAEGNQRIATSVLLALGCALAVWFALEQRNRARGVWFAAGGLCLLGLMLQDRRSGMLLLPLLALAWAWARQRSWLRRLMALAAIALLAGAAWQTSEGVRQRFDEGLRELHAYRADDQVATSWGQRLRMWQLTTAMVTERPLQGHGIGSWKILWRQRVTPGTPLAANSTPHSEYLLLAQQAGVLAPLLWLWWLLRGAGAALQVGSMPPLLLWTALAWTGLFNAVLRDAKFALPLLLLLSLTLALPRPPGFAPFTRPGQRRSDDAGAPPRPQ